MVQWTIQNRHCSSLDTRERDSKWPPVILMMKPYETLQKSETASMSITWEDVVSLGSALHECSSMTWARPSWRISGRLGHPVYQLWLFLVALSGNETRLPLLSPGVASWGKRKSVSHAVWDAECGENARIFCLLHLTNGAINMMLAKINRPFFQLQPYFLSLLLPVSPSVPGGKTGGRGRRVDFSPSELKIWRLDANCDMDKLNLLRILRPVHRYDGSTGSGR